MAENSILNLMIGHHALIEALLTVWEDSLGKDFEAAKENFDKFKWQLEKHIFVEERVIFIFCRVAGSDICQLVQELAREHKQLSAKLTGIENNLAAGKEVDSADFGRFLRGHRGKEEKLLYPQLDQELSEIQKRTVIERINEIALQE